MTWEKNKTLAIVVDEPNKLDLRHLTLKPAEAADAVIEVDWSGISTGTERLLWSGDMPPFPGMGYPLVPGYESVGRVIDAGPDAGVSPGDHVFIPGASCFEDARGLFGASAHHLIVPGDRLVALPDSIAEKGVLIALAATARHAAAAAGTGNAPDLVIGHGVLGRLIARIVMAEGFPAPTVWETNEARRGKRSDYRIIHPDTDDRSDYRCVCDASGDSSVLDRAIGAMDRRGQIILAGFYSAPLSFKFPPAFMKEATIRVAAEWDPEDLVAVTDAIGDGRLSLDGLITHHRSVTDAEEAYKTAFNDPECLKMIIDWRGDA